MLITSVYYQQQVFYMLNLKQIV